MGNITEFLYFIGSVFAPMIAVEVADYFILRRDRSENGIDVRNIIIWAIGFVIYRYLMNVDLVIGNTLPDMAITILICIIADKLIRK